MLLPDVNVLVHALRHEVPEHPLCKGWLDAVVAGEARFAISRLVLSFGSSDCHEPEGV